MDGALLIDKPSGLTSHDVVAWARRRVGQRDIGHTGTLDPMATGLLVLVLGKATRLSSLLTGKDKTYDAEIRLGFRTTTDDAEGEPVGERGVGLPTEAEIRDALTTFHGSFEQLPPAFSAKKVGGRVAHEMARRHQPIELKPTAVTLRSVDWVGMDDDRVRVRLTVAAGFYVRALARDLGARLGCGAHLSALRRTASGAFQLSQAVTLTEAEAAGAALAGRVISPADAIPDVPAVALTESGCRRVHHGNAVSAADVVGSAHQDAGIVKVLGARNELLALARWRGGSLHPVAVLG